MRPRRGTELNNRWIFLFLVVIGALLVIANLVRLVQADSALVAVLDLALAAVGAGGVWRGGYMLEWWGTPEPQ